MISPPVSRLAGSPSPAARQAANASAGRRPTVTGATNVSVGGGAGGPSRTNTMAGAGAASSAAADHEEKVMTTPGAPLMQRPAAAITGDVNIWTLTFKDGAMESKYRQDTSELFPSAMRQLVTSCMAVCVVGIVVDIPQFDDATVRMHNISSASLSMITHLSFCLHVDRMCILSNLG
jgi:hypothetical protein